MRKPRNLYQKLILKQNQTNKATHFTLNYIKCKFELSKPPLSCQHRKNTTLIS